MAFHFQPSADSSDEGEVDITAWQGGAKKPRSSAQPPAPIASMYSTAHDDEVEEGITAAFQQANASTAEADAGEQDDDDEQMGLSINGGSETPQLVSDKRTPSQGPRSFVQSGFTSINQPVGDAASESEDEIEISLRRSRSKSKAGTTKRNRKLVPRVARNEVDVDEYEDLTKGGDVVRRVKKEAPSKRGMIRYLVEFMDHTIREVRANIIL